MAKATIGAMAKTVKVGFDGSDKITEIVESAVPEYVARGFHVVETGDSDPDPEPTKVRKGTPPVPSAPDGGNA